MKLIFSLSSSLSLATWNHFNCFRNSSFWVLTFRSATHLRVRMPCCIRSFLLHLSKNISLRTSFSFKQIVQTPNPETSFERRFSNYSDWDEISEWRFRASKPHSSIFQATRLWFEDRTIARIQSSFQCFGLSRFRHASLMSIWEKLSFLAIDHLVRSCVSIMSRYLCVLRF